MSQNTHSPEVLPNLAVFVIGLDRDQAGVIATGIVRSLGGKAPLKANEDAFAQLDREASLRLGLEAHANARLQVISSAEFADQAEALPCDRGAILLKEKRGDSRLVVVEGAASGMLLPFWEEAALRGGFKACIVLLTTPGLSADALEWLQYMLLAERATRHLPRLIVSAGSPAGLPAPEVWIARTWSFSSVDGDLPEQDKAATYGVNCLPGFNSWVRRCEVALGQLAAGMQEAQACQELDRIQAALDAALALFTPTLADGRVAADRLRRENVRLRNGLSELQVAAASVDRDWKALSEELQEGKVLAFEREKELAQIRDEAAQLRSEGRDAAERNARFQAELRDARSRLGRSTIAAERTANMLSKSLEQRLRASSGPVAGWLKRRGWGYKSARRIERHLAVVEAFLDDLPWEVVGVHPEGRRARILAYLAGATEFLPDFPVVQNSEYLDIHPDVADSGMTPLVHFIAHGQGELRDPHPLFDTQYYLEQCPEAVHLASSPIIHYLRWGADKGHFPHPLLGQRTDGAGDEDSKPKGNPLLYYISHPNAVVDARFDLKFYSDGYPDVIAAGRHPLAHYLGIGWKEGRNPNRWFDTRYYLAGDRALKASGGNPLVHYVRTGWRERRSPGPDFDAAAYAALTPALPADCDALSHYILHGREEGRPITPVAKHRYSKSLVSDQTRVALMIEALYPRPDLDSGSLDHVNFARIFQRLGYEVHFLALLEFGGNHDEHTSRYRAELEAMGVHCVTSADHAYVEGYYFDVSDAVDVCFVSRVHFGGLQIETLRRLCPDARIVFNTVDLHFLREEREGTLKNDPALLLRAARTREMELEFVVAADAAIVVSSSEKAMLDELVPEAATYVVPLIRQFAPLRERPFAQRRDIAFIGGFNHQPNVDAVEHFLADIWPRVHRRRPEIGFRVVGANMPADWVRRKVPGVTFVGFVEDLDDELTGLRMTVAPLRYGAGAKGKLVSSLAAGVPAVVSDIASEGMGLADGDTVLSAGDDEAFASAIIQLHDDEALWQRLSRNGADFIREHYSIDAGHAIMQALLAENGLMLPVDHGAKEG